MPETQDPWLAVYYFNSTSATGTATEIHAHNFFAFDKKTKRAMVRHTGRSHAQHVIRKPQLESPGSHIKRKYEDLKQCENDQRVLQACIYRKKLKSHQLRRELCEMRSAAVQPKKEINFF